MTKAGKTEFSTAQEYVILKISYKGKEEGR